MRKLNCLFKCWKKSLCFPSVARVFAPLSATSSLKLRSSEATVTPRSSEFKNYCRHDGIEQPQWDMDWVVSWLWPDRPLRRLPRKGANSRKAFPHWLRKTKEITPVKGFLEIRYSWLLFNFFLGVWSLDETIFLLIYTSQVLYITYHIHCQFLVGLVVGVKGGLLDNFDTLMGLDFISLLNQFHWKPGNKKPLLDLSWAPFLERPGNFSCPKANFQI